MFPVAIAVGLCVAMLATGVAANGDGSMKQDSANGQRILFLGNSITLHSPAPDIGWIGNWGMAASAEEHDYVHILLQRLTVKSGGVAPCSEVGNIADFERAYSTSDIQAIFAKYAAFKPNIVIIAIGENVSPLVTDDSKAQFKGAIARMLAIVKTDATTALYVRSSFWPDPAKDAILRQACLDAGETFVDISALAGNEENSARSTHQFQNPGVAAHPGDKGMLAIADAIWAAMLAREAAQSQPK